MYEKKIKFYFVFYSFFQPYAQLLFKPNQFPVCAS